MAAHAESQTNGFAAAEVYESDKHDMTYGSSPVENACQGVVHQASSVAGQFSVHGLSPVELPHVSCLIACHGPKATGQSRE